MSAFNVVTKLDKFPIPQIDDLLDQLGEPVTLDLAAGYWQIKVDEASQEKTAFIILPTKVFLNLKWCYLGWRMTQQFCEE